MRGIPPQQVWFRKTLEGLDRSAMRLWAVNEAGTGRLQSNDWLGGGGELPYEVPTQG